MLKFRPLQVVRLYQKFGSRTNGSSPNQFRKRNNDYNNNSYGGNSYNRGDQYNNRRQPRQNYKQDAEDSKLIQRNRSTRHQDDGLRGLPNYELDKEAIKNLVWTDLCTKIEAGAEASADAAAAHSDVNTQTLADKKLLSLPLVNSLIYNRKYTSLTPVQAQTLVPILNDQSVVVRAKTGTGKTAAFAIPTIQKVLEAKQDESLKNKVKAVIISPTRELAQQISDEISKILDYGGLHSVSVQCFVGGLSKGEQLRNGGFRPGRQCCDIVVATPGRLDDILEDEEVLEKFDSLIYRVFDEADRLLDIGFENLLRKIRDRIDSVTSEDREVPLLLFSATADRNVRRFASDQFGDRVKLIDTISKDEPTANELVDQSVVTTKDWAEIYEGVAQEICESYENKGTGNFKAIVFMPTVAMVDNYAQVLYQLLPKQRGNSIVMAIHGQKTQATRQKLSDKFRNQDDAILVTTDVIARGMDFPRVSHVYQVGPPPDVPSYIHRIGRTARIGNKGKSSLYLTNHVRQYIASLGRENIEPALSTFKSDPEFHETFIQTVPLSVRESEEPDTIINSLMSYMTVLKSKYPVQPRQFLDDMLPFAQLYELEELNLSRSNAETWENQRSRRPQYNKNYGSSRKSRMRW